MNKIFIIVIMLVVVLFFGSKKGLREKIIPKEVDLSDVEIGPKP